MSKELKSVAFAKKFDLENKIQIDSKTGVVTLDENFYESTLEDTGLTMDQVKKLQKHDAALLAATTLVAGEKAADIFKNNEDITSVTVQYTAGNTTYSSMFHNGKGTNSTVLNMSETTIGSNDTELRKVHKHLKSLFSSINS